MAKTFVDFHTQLNISCLTCALTFIVLIVLTVLVNKIPGLSRKDQNNKNRTIPKTIPFLIILIITGVACFFIYKMVKPFWTKVRQTEVNIFGTKGTAAIDAVNDLDSLFRN